MSQPRQELALLPLTLIAGLMATIFAVDLLLPRGVAIPMLYVVPILLAVQCRQQWFRVSVVAGCTAMTLAAYVISEPGAPIWMAVTNRALAIAAIWITAVLAWERAKAREHIAMLRNLLPMCASCHKIRDDKGYWSQVEQYLESHTQTTLTHGICPECLQKWYPDFYPQVVEQYPDLFKDVSVEIPKEQLRQAEEHR
ncbi:MAG: hypothetical protein ACREI9_01450 [Nitrospiraceae bacterium]